MSKAATEFVIEKGVPLTPTRGGNGLAAVLQSMEVGDSFALPLARRATVASVFSRFRPKQFKSRTVGEGQVRVWRTA